MLATAGLAYTSVAALLVRRGYFGAPPKSGGDPGVTLLKPLFLEDSGLEADLRSFFRQTYDGPVQIVFGVHSHSDPALAIAQRIAAEFPSHDVDFVVDPSAVGLNPKMANLNNMIGRARHNILIMSDSDIRVGTDYVRTLVAELERPGTGAVTCLYRGKPTSGIWSVFEAMHIDFAFLPGVVFGTTLHLTRPCFGSTIAMRASTLADIGGFAGLSRHLADDYEIGRAVRAKGRRVVTSSLVVEHTCSEASLAELFRHELRWAKTVRMLDAAGHAGSVITHPFPLSLIAAACLGPSVSILALLFASLAVRLWLGNRVRGAIASQAGPLWLLPVRDILSFAIFLASFFGNTVYWRGTRYLTRANGVLAQQ